MTGMENVMKITITSNNQNFFAQILPLISPFFEDDYQPIMDDGLAEELPEQLEKFLEAPSEELAEVGRSFLISEVEKFLWEPLGRFQDRQYDRNSEGRVPDGCPRIIVGAERDLRGDDSPYNTLFVLLKGGWKEWVCEPEGSWEEWMVTALEISIPRGRKMYFNPRKIHIECDPASAKALAEKLKETPDIEVSFR